ncbi:MAG: extracellular solute-binding protein [Clostridia bacterium]|nr:extracellular solute-binding protein [Clostridia bacterium]
MKRSFGALVLILLWTVLSGCNLSDNTYAGDPADNKSVQIVDWIGNSGNYSTFMEDMNREFERRNKNIILKKVVHNGDRVADFEIAQANKNAPDMIILSYPMLSRYADKNMLEPLNDYMSAWEEAGAFKSDILENCTVDGRIYGVPGDCYYMGMVYNKKLFREANLEEPPKNWDELLEYAKILTDSGKNQVGFGLLTGEWVDWWFEFFVWQAGGELTYKGEKGEIICNFTDEAVIKAAELYRRLKTERVICPELDITNAELQKRFAKGKVGITFGAIGDINVFTEAGMNKEDIGYAVFPVGPAGKNPSQFGGNMYSINAQSPPHVKEAAFKYISYLRSKEYLKKQRDSNEENNTASSYVSVRNDIDLKQTIADKNILDVLNSAQNNYKMEYYGKGIVGEYLNEALNNILKDDNLDIYEELKTAQEKAEKASRE